MNISGISGEYTNGYWQFLLEKGCIHYLPFDCSIARFKVIRHYHFSIVHNETLYIDIQILKRVKSKYNEVVGDCDQMPRSCKDKTSEPDSLAILSESLDSVYRFDIRNRDIALEMSWIVNTL